MLRSRPLLMLGFVVFALCEVGHAAKPAAQPSVPGPQYAEEANGTSAIWVQTGPLGWLTDHRPLAEFMPLNTSVAFSHQIGHGRLAWRVSLAHREGTDATTFLNLDFFGAERVYVAGPFRPFIGFAFGMGLDLQGAGLSLGDDGYFNETNGASGGLAVAGMTGADVRFGSRYFLRIESSLRAYGGAGRTGLIWTAQSGLGLDL